MVQMAPRQTAGCVLGILAALATLPPSTGQAGDLSCPAETFVCLGDSDCGSCLETLQNAGISLDFEFTECSELYADVCAVVEDAGCDITNSNLESFAACIAEEDFGCPGFVSCEAVGTTAAPTAAPTPAPMMTEAPTAMAGVTTTIAPSSEQDAADAREADADSGVSRTVAAAATKTAMAFACGLALFLSV